MFIVNPDATLIEDKGGLGKDSSPGFYFATLITNRFTLSLHAYSETGIYLESGAAPDSSTKTRVSKLAK